MVRNAEIYHIHLTSKIVFFFRSVQVDEVINEKLLKKQGEVELLQKMRDSLEEDFTKLRDEAFEKRQELAKHYQ